jgi:hypothetical protein
MDSKGPNIKMETPLKWGSLSLSMLVTHQYSYIVNHQTSLNSQKQYKSIENTLFSGSFRDCQKRQKRVIGKRRTFKYMTTYKTTE